MKTMNYLVHAYFSPADDVTWSLLVNFVLRLSLTVKIFDKKDV